MKERTPVRIWLLFIAIAAVLSVAGFFGAIFTYYNIIPLKYSSTGVVYVLSDTNTGAEATDQDQLYQGLRSGTEIARDLTNFISSEAGLAQLRRSLGANIPWLLTHRYNASDHFIIATHDSQSRIISIQVLCDNPYDAATIANGCMDVLTDLAGLMYGKNYVQPLNVAEVATEPSAPDRALVLLLGVGIGLVVSAGIDMLIWMRLRKKRLEGHRRERLEQRHSVPHRTRAISLKRQLKLENGAEDVGASAGENL